MSWQIAFGLGLGLTLSITTLIGAVVPGRPRLQAAVSRVDSPAGPALVSEPGATGLDRLVHTIGAWLTQRLQDRHIPGLLPRQQDLAITGSSLPVHLGQKATAALLGAIAGPLLARMLGLAVGSSVLAALVFAALGYVYVNLTLKQKASTARREFTEAAVIYLELLAIARLSGAGAAQSMEDATEVADHPGLARIGQVLAQAHWTGASAWQGLDQEAERLDLPQMRTIADITRTAGEDESEIYTNLRARSASLRNAQIARVKEAAKRASVTIAIPITGMLFVFCIALIYPFIQGLHL